MLQLQPPVRAAAGRQHRGPHLRQPQGSPGGHGDYGDGNGGHW